MTTDSIPPHLSTLSLLVKLYTDQALAAWTAGNDADARFYDGAASGVRVALQILVPMIDPPKKVNGGGKTGLGRSKQPSTPATNPPPVDATFPEARKDRKGWHCPECDAVYKLVQHLGMHRKREHGVPSKRDLAGRMG